MDCELLPPSEPHTTCATRSALMGWRAAPERGMPAQAQVRSAISLRATIPLPDCRLTSTPFALRCHMPLAQHIRCICCPDLSVHARQSPQRQAPIPYIRATHARVLRCMAMFSILGPSTAAASCTCPTWLPEGKRTHVHILQALRHTQ